MTRQQNAASGVSVQSVDRLTPRELEVVSLAYLSNADIALLLGTSAATVKAQIHSALIKMGADNRTQAYSMFRDTQEVMLPKAA